MIHLDKEMNSDAGYDNDDVLSVLMFAEKNNVNVGKMKKISDFKDN